MAKKKNNSAPNAIATKHQGPPKSSPFNNKSPNPSRAAAKNINNETTTTKKKKNKLGPSAIAMKLQAPKPNPFETIWSRRKFDILGKKRKGEEKRIGLSRSRAIDKRKKTLLKEYEQSNKSSVFDDKRIGEQNDELDEFDKAIRRAQRERVLKLNKKNKFNLSDGEEDEFEFQGLGALSERDDFEDDTLPDDDDYGTETARTKNQFSSTDMQNLPYNDVVEGEENRHKSNKEAYKDVMAKQKYYKAERAKEKEELEQYGQELDKIFTAEVRSKLSELAEPDKSFPIEHSKKDELFEQENARSYHQILGTLRLDARGQPSDRTKTPEEIAQEEREKLEHLEEERQKRMLATDDYSNDDNEDAEIPSTQRPRAISGDDLGDSFSLNEDPRIKKGWVDAILDRKDASDSEREGGDSSEDSESSEGRDEGSDEDNNQGERNLILKDWEQSDDDNLGTDLDEEETEEDEGEEHEKDDDDEEETEPRHLKKLKKKDSSEASEKEWDALDAKKISENGKRPSIQSDLPYLIEAPKSLEELGGLVDDLSNTDIVLIINRIRKTNAIKLAAENRKKMQVFYGVLLQYFAILANKKPLNMELLNFLVKQLIEMSMETPYFAAICARQRILRTRTEFCVAIKNPENSCWPSSKTLFLLRLWSLIWSCSDFFHVVMTPARSLINEYLLRCPIVSGRDAAVGSYLCYILLCITKQSRNLCPEALIFLQTMLIAAKDRNQMPDQDSQFNHLVELKAVRSLLCIRECIGEVDPLDFFTIMDLPEDSSFFSSNNFRASVLVTAIETLRGFVSMGEGFKCFPELFLPISVLLLEVAEQENMPQALTDKFKDVAQLIKTKAEEHHLIRQPVQMRKQNPVAIRMLNPKFEENYVKGRDYDPDRERAERRKMKKLLKQEAKGAIRELRKDNSFLYEVKAKDKALMEEERAEKYGKVRLFLQEQEHAMRSGQLGKGKGGKRRR